MYLDKILLLKIVLKEYNCFHEDYVFPINC
jgi:hypothetical protein